MSTPIPIPAQESYRLPSDVTLKHAAKLGMVEDKPIMLDYWTASLDKKALIGVKENNEKLLPFIKIYKFLIKLLTRDDMDCCCAKQGAIVQLHTEFHITTEQRKIQ